MRLCLNTVYTLPHSLQYLDYDIPFLDQGSIDYTVMRTEMRVHGNTSPRVALIPFFLPSTQEEARLSF